MLCSLPVTSWVKQTHVVTRQIYGLLWGTRMKLSSGQKDLSDCPTIVPKAMVSWELKMNSKLRIFLHSLNLTGPWRLTQLFYGGTSLVVQWLRLWGGAGWIPCWRAEIQHASRGKKAQAILEDHGHPLPSLNDKQKEGKWKQWQISSSWALKSLWMVTAAMKSDGNCFLAGKLWQTQAVCWKAETSLCWQRSRLWSSQWSRTIVRAVL